MGPRLKQPKTLSALNKDQIIHVAATLYETHLEKAMKVDQVRERLGKKMTETLECDNMACQGGPCNPGVHVFSPSMYVPDDQELLLQTSQAGDIPLRSLEASPGVLPTADGLEQQRRLAQEALQSVGLSLEQVVASNTSTTASNHLPQPATATRQKASAFRNLFASFGLTASTPAPATHSRPATPVAAGQDRQQGEPGSGMPRPVPVLGQQGVATEPPSQTDALMALLQRQEERAEEEAAERARERLARQERDKNQDALTNKLAEMLGTKIAGGGGSGEPAPGKGKVTMLPPHNPAALAMVGCTLGPRWAMSGDMSNVDLAYVKKHIKSGQHGTQLLDARTAEVWPNQYLDSLLADGLDGIKFEQLTWNQFIGGYVTKVFSEVDESRNGTPEHNQLFMLIKMVRLKEMYPWEDVRKIIHGLFQGLDRGAFDWVNRGPMVAWWDQAVESLRHRIASRVVTQAGAAKRPAPAAAPGSSGQPPAKTQKLKGKDVFGVEASLLKNNGICIKWNTGSCQIQADTHDSPDKSDTRPVRHVCGGCWALAKVEDSSHPMKSCSRRGKDGLFH